MKSLVGTGIDSLWMERPFNPPAYRIMKFVILGFDGPEGQMKRKLHRSAHLASLEPLNKAGKVILAGPFTDQTGSLIIIDVDSLDEAKRIATNDPYTVHEIFERVEVHPFEQVLPFSSPR
jgi:uncharacterized protein